MNHSQWWLPLIAVGWSKRTHTVYAPNGDAYPIGNQPPSAQVVGETVQWGMPLQTAYYRMLEHFEHAVVDLEYATKGLYVALLMGVDDEDCAFWCTAVIPNTPEGLCPQWTAIKSAQDPLCLFSDKDRFGRLAVAYTLAQSLPWEPLYNLGVRKAQLVFLRNMLEYHCDQSDQLDNSALSTA